MLVTAALFLCIYKCDSSDQKEQSLTQIPDDVYIVICLALDVHVIANKLHTRTSIISLFCLLKSLLCELIYTLPTFNFLCLVCIVLYFLCIVCLTNTGYISIKCCLL